MDIKIAFVFDKKNSWIFDFFQRHKFDGENYSFTYLFDIDEVYDFDISIIEKFDTAINAYYKPELKPIIIQLFLNKEISKYFIRKPISITQRLIKNYDDGSCDIELTVTDFMEIIPTIQKFIPYIGVIEPIELKNIIKKNLETYINEFE